MTTAERQTRRCDWCREIIHASEEFCGCEAETEILRLRAAIQSDGVLVPTKTMIDRFLSWPLPKSFNPDCGIRFDGRKDDEWNKNKTWPVGTNLFSADEARQMLEYVLAPSQRAAEDRDSSAQVASPAAVHQQSNPRHIALGGQHFIPPASPPNAAPAPSNSLPTYDECALRVSNSNYLAKRKSEGGYGPEADSLTATELHRFIHEYDDADPYRSAWFMHRLEKLIEEIRAAPSDAAQAGPVAWQVRRVGDEDGNSIWNDCSDMDASIFAADKYHEVRPLYLAPPSQLAAGSLEDNEQYRMQMAAIGTVSMMNTRNTALDRLEQGHPYWTLAYQDVCDAVDREMKWREQAEKNAAGWIDGAPSHPWDKEWFIAQTTLGDKVVLTALPEEYTYDYKTADETYIKADKIKRWMPFPDSQYVAPPNAAGFEAGVREATEAQCDSVRGILQLLRGKTGATFKDVRNHCTLRGDNVNKWPQWAQDAEGYVDEESAARLIYTVMSLPSEPAEGQA